MPDPTPTAAAPRAPDRITQRLAGAREYRAYTLTGSVELRHIDPDPDSDGGGLTLSGHASVFDVWYPMWGGPDAGGWNERVADGAFSKTLREKPDVQLLVNHDGLPLARTKSGTLRLEEDSVGLRVAASLDPDDPDVRALRSKLGRGDLDEMSFAFRTVRQEWNDDYTERTLVELSLHRGDVSIVNYGANPYTAASLRSLLADADPAQVVAEIRAAGQLPHVAPVLLAALNPEDRAAPEPPPAAPPAPAVPLPRRRLLAERTLTLHQT